MAEIIGKNTRPIDTNYDKASPDGKRFLSGARKHRTEVVNRWKVRLGKRRSFGMSDVPQKQFDAIFGRHRLAR